MRGQELLDKLELLSPELIQSAAEDPPGVEETKGQRRRGLFWSFMGGCAAGAVCLSLALLPLFLGQGDSVEPGGSSAAPLAGTPSPSPSPSPSPKAPGIEPVYVEWTQDLPLEKYFAHEEQKTDGEKLLKLPRTFFGYDEGESRSFSFRQEELEEEGDIPSIDSAWDFTCYAWYDSGSTPKSLSMRWEWYEVSDQIANMNTEEIGVQIAGRSNFISPESYIRLNRTVVRRDGAEITVLGQMDSQKFFVFQKDGAWHLIRATAGVPQEMLLQVLDHFFQHPADFRNFSKEAGDIYEWAELETCPEAFAGYYPQQKDSELVPPLAGAEVLLLNGEPVRIQCVYDSDTVTGTLLQWTVYKETPDNQPDPISRLRAAGDLHDFSQESVSWYFQQMPAGTGRNIIYFTWDGYRVEAQFAEKASPEDVIWPILETMREQSRIWEFSSRWSKAYGDMEAGKAPVDPAVSMAVFPKIREEYFFGDLRDATLESVEAYLSRPEIRESGRFYFMWEGYYAYAQLTPAAEAAELYGFIVRVRGE